MRDLAIVIVGRDAAPYVRQCLESISTTGSPRSSPEVIYVDNASRDETLPMLRERFPGVRSIANPENRGFCRAANQGAAIADARYFAFLNDDTIVLPGALDILVEFLDATPGAGAVASRLLYPDGTDQWSGRRFPSPINAVLGRRSWLSRLFPNARPLADYLCREETRGTAPFVVDWVSAAAVMIRREAFEAVGGFAEDYYYWHEAVICDRIRRAGWRVFVE
ncbi:MAG: glycosyltransferase family 2 protein, partial [Gemmatimonadales bacterium]